LLLASGVNSILPYFEFLGDPGLRLVVAVLSVLLLPPLLGSLIRFVIFPFVEKRVAWGNFSNWDERLFSEVARAKQAAEVVVVDWPSSDLRTMGVLTRTFSDESTGDELAAVYLLSTSTNRHGYIHVCRLSDLTLTNWTLQQWQLFQVTLGAFGPESVQSRRGRK
jgi:hypothetical protein